MCGVIILVPIITSWPIFMAAAASVAAQLGMASAKNKLSSEEQELLQEQALEIELKDSDILSESMTYEESFTIDANGIKVTFVKDARGKCKMVVTGEGFTESQKKQAAEKIKNKVIQQYTLEMVKQELTSRGFDINEQETTADGSIKLNVTRWD